MQSKGCSCYGSSAVHRGVRYRLSSLTSLVGGISAPQLYTVIPQHHIVCGRNYLDLGENIPTKRPTKSTWCIKKLRRLSITIPYDAGVTANCDYAHLLIFHFVGLHVTTSDEI